MLHFWRVYIVGEGGGECVYVCVWGWGVGVGGGGVADIYIYMFLHSKYMTGQ